jgi:predicted nucleic acid-binding protein
MVRVIDASVGIKWFVQEARGDTALQVLADVLEEPAAFAVPELFFFELVHVFNRLIPSPTKEQLFLLETVLELGIVRFNMTCELFRETGRFQKLGLSGYDAAYVALASQLKGKWLTYDSQAHKCVRKTGLSVLLA